MYITRELHSFSSLEPQRLGLAFPYLESGMPCRVALKVFAHHGRGQAPSRCLLVGLALSMAVTDRTGGRPQRSDGSAGATTPPPKGLRPYTPNLGNCVRQALRIGLGPSGEWGAGAEPRGGGRRETRSWSVTSRLLAAMPSRIVSASDLSEERGTFFFIDRRRLSHIVAFTVGRDRAKKECPLSPFCCSDLARSLKVTAS